MLRPKKKEARYRHSEKGFILPVTLFVLAAIILAVGWYSTWTSRMLHRAGTQKDAVQFELDASSTMALLLFQLSQGKTSHRGMLLPSQEISPAPGMPDKPTPLEVFFDDTCYHGTGRVKFSIQDEFGLIGVRLYSTAQLKVLLSLMGIAPEEQAALLDKAADYQDPDDLTRLNGAEEKLYTRKGMAGPANAPLLTPMELYNVLGWNHLDKLWWNSEFQRLITTHSSGIPAMNTAPPLALQTIPLVDESVAATIVARRKDHGFASLSSLEAAIGLSLGIDPFGLSFYSSRYLRISLWQANIPFIREIHVTLHRMADKQTPWTLEYERIIPKPANIDQQSCETVEEIFSK